MADTNVITPYDRIEDVVVNLQVQKPVPTTGYGNFLLLNKVDSIDDIPNNAVAEDGLLKSVTDSKTQAVFKEYSDLNALELDFDDSTATYLNAQFYFAQKYASDRIAVLNYVDGKLYDSLGAFWFQNWYFMAFVDDTNTDDILLASNIAEANKLKLLLTQGTSTDDFSAWEGNDYTIDLIHPLKERFAAGLVGRVASRAVGTQTWKFKAIEGLSPQDYSDADYADIVRHHAIVYINVNDAPETSEGWTSSGEYIDNLHGDTWIKVNVQANVQKAFQNNDKIPYEKSGIDLLTSIVQQTLSTAWLQGIILTDDATKKGDFTVTATDRSAQSLEDLSKRHYGGISFTAHRSGAIHSATINGLVISDTMTAEKSPTPEPPAPDTPVLNSASSTTDSITLNLK